MNLHQIANALTACAITDPWDFDGSDFLDTLCSVNVKAGALQLPFSPALELNDRFIVVQHIGHVPESSVYGFASRAEVETFIAGPAGLTNPFTTFCIAFVDGHVCPFQLLYRDGAQDVVFSKATQLASDDVCGTEYPALRVAWLTTDPPGL